MCPTINIPAWSDCGRVKSLQPLNATQTRLDFNFAFRPWLFPHLLQPALQLRPAQVSPSLVSIPRPSCCYLSCQHQRTAVNMSSPSGRRTRNAASSTPGRSTRSSQAARSSPAPGAPDAAENVPERTPRQTRASQLASSPMFFQSSPANAAAGASSPLRQMSNTQTTNSQPANGAPSSPLRQQTDTQSTDGDRTPRASALIGGASS